MAYNMSQSLSESAKSNIDEIELDAITSSQYFKPKPGTTYVIRIDLDKHKIKPVENPKFTDTQGRPPITETREKTSVQGACHSPKNRP